MSYDNGRLETFKDSIKSRLTYETVQDIVSALGFEIGRDHRFRIRDEKTPSTVIRKKSLIIRDYGGDFDGDIIALVQLQRNCSFIDALNYIAPFVGLQEIESYSSKTVIPRALPKAVRRESEKDEAKLQFAQKIKEENKRTITPELAYRGIKELYPFIGTDFKTAKHMEYLGWSNYHNSLTFEYPNLSINRKTSKGKWIATTTNSRDFIPYRITEQSKFVFLYSGMAERIAIEEMGLDFIGLQMDQSDRYISDEIILKMRGKTLVVLEENDPQGSSQKLTKRLIEKFDTVKTLNLSQLAGSNEKGYDLRDYINQVQSFDTAKLILIATANTLPIEAKEANKDEAKEIKVPYNGDYITTGQTLLDIETLDKAVIVALTGSGKTYPFQDKPGVLILVPTNALATVYAGEDSDYLIGKTLDSGAMITYDKFYGHFIKSKEFRQLVTEKKIRLVVDEAHMLLYNAGSLPAMLIYGMDAIFLSGTIEKFFRPDLPRYKFIPEKKAKIFYTKNKLPDFENALYFVNRAEAIVNNYEQVVVGKDRASELDHENFNIDSYESGKIVATEAIREGISITKELEAVVVDAKTCSRWSTKDIIQALHRGRNKRTIRVVSKQIQQAKPFKATMQHLKQQAEELLTIREVNAALGEFHSKLAHDATIGTQYVNPTEFGIACYMARMTRDRYDEDLYEFIEYTEPLKELKLELRTDGLKEEDTEHIAIRVGDKNYKIKAKSERRFKQWIRLKNAGLTKGYSSYKGKWTSFIDFYRGSRFVAKMRESIRIKHPDAQYTMHQAYRDLKRTVKVEFKDSKGNKVKRVNDPSELKDLYFKVIDECPIAHELVQENQDQQQPQPPAQNEQAIFDTDTMKNSFKVKGIKSGIAPPA